MRYLQSALAALFITVFALDATALDLPVKSIGGKEYYYYTVGRRETVYGVSRRLGLSREDIVRHNPAAADGLRQGTVLYFPVEEFGQAEEITGADNSGDALQPDGNPGADGYPGAGITMHDGSVLIALPMGMPGEQTGRQRQYVDFYRGALIAADTLARRSVTMTIHAENTSAGDSLPATPPAVAILAPGADATEMLAAGTYVFSPFDTRDTAYLHCPTAVQPNIPAAAMYAKAADALISRFGQSTPVLLTNTGGRNEKSAFTDTLKTRLLQAGRQWLQIDYDGSLSRQNLEGIAPDSSYVFVPSSGSLAEFNKFAHVIANLQAADRAVDPDSLSRRIDIFGYPDWLAFRGESELLLHQMEATIFSRFLDNPSSFRERNLREAFSQWYGAPMGETIPSQGILGYDLANYVIRAINAGDGTFDPAIFPAYTGIQSAFRFKQIPGGGWVNTALYIISFDPSGNVSGIIL